MMEIQVDGNKLNEMMHSVIEDWMQDDGAYEVLEAMNTDQLTKELATKLKEDTVFMTRMLETLKGHIIEQIEEDPEEFMDGLDFSVNDLVNKDELKRLVGRSLRDF
jgi:hypothetical protein